MTGMILAGAAVPFGSHPASELDSRRMRLATESYATQQARWPATGHHTKLGVDA